MNLTANDIAQLLWATIVKPADTARVILRMQPPREALWLGVALVTVLSVLLVGLLEALLPAPLGDAAANAISPLAYAAILAGSLVATVFALQVTGRALGGAGNFDDMLTLVVWLQFLLIALQAVEIVFVLVIPVLGMLLALASIAIMFWCLVHFVNVLHGFDSLGKAALTVVLGFFGLGLAIALVLIVMSAGSAAEQF